MAVQSEVGEWQGNADLTVVGKDGKDIVVGSFQKRTGGAVDSEEAKWGSGGMTTEIARGGRRSRDNIVLTRAYSPDRDGPLYTQLVEVIGRGKATGNDYVYDIHGNVADTLPFSGILKKVDRGDYDSSSKDQRDFVIEISADA